MEDDPDLKKMVEKVVDEPGVKDHQTKLDFAITKKELRVVSEWMAQNKVPTMGPQASIKLHEIEDAMREKAKEIEDPEVRMLIMKYTFYVGMTAMLNGLASGVVIDQMANLLKDTSND